MSEPVEKRVVVPADIDSIEGLYAFLQESLDFPGWFGRNLNALWDCATADIEKPVCVVWPRHWTCGNPYHYLEAIRMLDVLREASQENPNLRVEMSD
ncbi:barstar family protein [Bremerella sp. JC770]|uniref:barstar family protein n=1 Tax=Bremerella sp. JC770 TaxID=3232137 RepID=UPI00345AADBF